MDKSISKINLFNAACISLIVTAMTFAVRAGILTDLGTQFELNDTQLGYINSLAFLGFPVATVVGGLLYNYLGARKLMIIAFISHVLGLVMTIFAASVNFELSVFDNTFHMGGFEMLLISSFFIGFANGSVEAGCNPLIADMYTKNRTTMLNKFHVWFPGGIVIGALLVTFMNTEIINIPLYFTNFSVVNPFFLDWQYKIAVMLIPTAIYGYLFFKEDFPESENIETDTSTNIQSLVSPLFLFILACMTLTAISEFGPQQWIERILGNSGANPMLILAMVTGIMAIGRYFAGPIIHRLNPIGVLLMSAILTSIAVYSMSLAGGNMIYIAAILFAFGVCYFWPTMIGFVSEYLPKTGALGMSLVGGAGMLSTAIWQPVIGSWLDKEKQIALNSGLEENAAEVFAGQAALGNMAFFPLFLVFLFGFLFFFRKKLNQFSRPIEINFSYKGRISRLDYLVSIILYIIATFLIGIILSFFGVNDGNIYGQVIILLAIAPLFIWMFFQGTKRCHDIGSSGWFQLIPFYALWMLFGGGDNNENKFGPSPKE